MLSCIALTMALLVMTALATAVSTRFGQVMTIMICAIVFLLGLMSNYFIGRHVYSNERIAEIAGTRSPINADAYDFRRDEVWELAAERNGMPVEEFIEEGFDPRNYVSVKEVMDMGPVDDPEWREIMLREPGSTLIVDLLGPPIVELKAGDSFYYGAAPNGVGLITPEFTPFRESDELIENMRDEPGLVIVEIDPKSYGQSFLVKQIGRDGVVPVARPPLSKDSMFLKPTSVNPGPMVAWSIIPNMQSYWLIDAINKNEQIPMSHIGLVGMYTFFQILVFLGLAVFLFQGRDVG